MNQQLPDDNGVPVVGDSHDFKCALRVVSLSPADNAAGPLWSQPRDVNRTVMTLTSGAHGLVQAVGPARRYI
jgi:hypothetical protein